MTLSAKLSAGIAELGLPIDAATQQRLLDYLALIHKWNKVHNLTAIREPEEMVTLHLLDGCRFCRIFPSTSLRDE